MSKPIQVCVLGGNRVGKTNVVSQLTSGKFVPKPQSNYGTLFKRKRIGNLSLKFWDTAGFMSITRYARDTFDLYYTCDAFVYVYSIDTNSLTRAKEGLEDIFENHKKKVPIFLVCNKIDFKTDATTLRNNINGGKSLAKKWGIKFFQVSCKTGHGFEKLSKEIVKACKSVKK